MNQVDRFYAWRKQKIEENPDWCDEERDWFLGMYLQTYPARSFPLVSELFNNHEGKSLETQDASSAED